MLIPYLCPVLMTRFLFWGEYGKTKIMDLDEMYYAVHNHPDNGALTSNDILNFLGFEKMICIEAPNKRVAQILL